MYTEIWSIDGQSKNIQLAEPTLNDYTWYPELMIVDTNYCVKLWNKKLFEIVNWMLLFLLLYHLSHQTLVFSLKDFRAKAINTWYCIDIRYTNVYAYSCINDIVW